MEADNSSNATTFLSEHNVNLESISDDSTRKVVLQIAMAVEKIISHSLVETNIYDKHLTALENCKAKANKRCDLIIEQNRELISIIKQKESEIKRYQDKLDRLMDVIESYAYSDTRRHSGSNATIAITDIEGLKRINEI